MLRSILQWVGMELLQSSLWQDVPTSTTKTTGSAASQETTIHVSVDSWIGSYASTQNQFAKEYPRLAAEDLGSMGYAGEESMYVSRAILQAAYSESGLALDFYKSYFACLSVFFLFKASRFSLKGATGVTFRSEE